MDNKTNANSSVNASVNAIDTKDAEDVALFVQTLLQQVQDKFQQMSDQILNRIDEMGHRIDDLEHNLNELMNSAGLNDEQVANNHSNMTSNVDQINK